MRLEGKIAIVTGTSPNIGGGIAQGLAEDGAAVVCVDVVPDNATQCAQWIVTRGGRAEGLECDVITGVDLRVGAGAVAKYWPWVPWR